MRSRRLLVLMSFLLSVVYSTTGLAQQSFPADSPMWKLEGKDISIEQFLGRSAIKVRSGKALLDGVTLQDGLIEFDMYHTGQRAFAYLYFRGDSDQEFEEIYFRTHKSEAPDTLQYSPVFQKRSAWQLYHGESGAVTAVLPANEWVSVKLELSGTKMSVWVGSKDEPVLVIDKLEHEPRNGYMAFRGFVPRTSNAPYAAYFSNLRITKTIAKASTPSKTPSLPSGQLTQWRVSPAFDSKAGVIKDLPAGLDQTQWDRAIMQDNGAFEFLRSRPIPKGARHWSVVARTTVKSSQKQHCALHLGFSDELSLSLNGQLLSYQDARYRFDKPRQQGLMHPEQAVIYLPLQKGDNEIQAIVSDDFGGWGLMARIEKCEGVTEI